MVVIRYSPRKFFDTRTDSTFSRYSPGFYLFSVSTQIRPFCDSRRESFSILARILRFPGTRPDSTNFRYSHRFDHFPELVGNIFRYSPRKVFDTRKDSTVSRYSPGFYQFSALTQMRPFFGTRRECFSVLAKILPFRGSRPDSTNFP